VFQNITLISQTFNAIYNTSKWHLPIRYRQPPNLYH